MAGIISIGTKVGHAASEVGPFVDIPGLLEVPAFGGKPSKVDVTCLSDGVKKYIHGVKDLGDLAFKFLYDNSETTSNYRVLKGLEDAGTLQYFKVEFPEGTTLTFSAFVSNEIDSTQVDKAISFTASMAVQSEIAVNNPAA